MARTLLIILLLAMATSGEAAIVRVRSSAIVERAIVRLMDVAEVFEDDAETLEHLQGVTIEPAPLPGQHRKLSLQQITDRLRAHGVDLSQVEFSGRTTVLVSRKAALPVAMTTAASSKVTPANVANDEKPVSTLVPVPVIRQVSDEERALKLKTSEIRDAERLVFELVRSYIQVNAPEWGNPRITVHVPTKLVPTLLDAPAGGLKLAAGEKTADGHFLVSIAITNEYGQTSLVKISTDIARRPKVVVTSRALAAGHVLSASDVELQEVDLATHEASDLALVVGKETKTTLRAGQRVMVDAVAEPTLIRRGDTINGVVSVGSIRVQREFKAMQNGRLNEVISLETIAGQFGSKNERPERRTGMVTGLKQAELVDVPEGSISTGLRVLRDSK